MLVKRLMDKKGNKTNYFSHDSNARNSDKLIRLRMRHKAAGYGVYFMILERLREEPNYMSVKDYNMIAFDLREDASLIKSVVEDFGLFVFTDDGKYFYSESFNRRMAVKDERARKQAEAGRKAMQRRWGKNDGKVTEKTTENGGKTTGNGGKSTACNNDNSSGSVTDLGENDNLLITNLGKNDNKKSKVKKSKEKESKEINKEKNKETKKEKNTCEENGKTVEEKILGTFKFFNEMIEYYHSSIRPVKMLTYERHRKLEDVVLHYKSEDIAAAMRNAMTSDYLNGRTSRRKLPADFDWIFEPKNFAKIFEGSV